MNLLAKTIILLLISIISEAYPESHVTVTNVISRSQITVHCFSKDDDLGTHQLTYLQPLSWKFHYNLVSNTEFFCTITTRFWSGNYMVYGNNIMVNRCGLDCLWKAQANGPCLQQSRDKPWCLPWQKNNAALSHF